MSLRITSSVARSLKHTHFILETHSDFGLGNSRVSPCSDLISRALDLALLVCVLHHPLTRVTP